LKTKNFITGGKKNKHDIIRVSKSVALYQKYTHIKACPVTGYTWSVNKVMRLSQYNSVFIFELQIEFVPFKIVPLGGYPSLETLFPLFVAALEVANRNRFWLVG
jgi:hypothetical protein